MAHEMSSEEKRIRRLEEEMNALRAAVASQKHQAGQTAEDDSRRFQPDGTGRILIRLQSVGIIPGSTGAAPGVGTARFLQLISGTRYLLQPFAQGDVTAACSNDTGGPTKNNEYMIGAFVDGVLTALVGDCVTASPARAPDPPA